MSNTCLRVTIEKNSRSQNFDFLSLKNLWQSQFSTALTHAESDNSIKKAT